MKNLNEILAFNFDQKFDCRLIQTQVQQQNLQKEQQKGFVVKDNKSNKKSNKYSRSLWSIQENMRYASFLQKNRQLFECSLQLKRSIKINHLMSRGVVSHSPAQCRSHHQKMLKHHSNINEILKYINQLQQYKNKQKQSGTSKQSLRLGRKQILTVPEQPCVLSLGLDALELYLYCRDQQYIQEFQQI